MLSSIIGIVFDISDADPESARPLLTRGIIRELLRWGLGFGGEGSRA